MALSSQETEIVNIINANKWKVSNANTLEIHKAQGIFDYFLFIVKSTPKISTTTTEIVFRVNVNTIENGKIVNTSYSREFSVRDDSTMYNACINLFNRYKAELDKVTSSVYLNTALSVLKSA